jgi:hypothetical protein
MGQCVVMSKEPISSCASLVLNICGIGKEQLNKQCQEKEWRNAIQMNRAGQVDIIFYWSGGI